MPEIAKATIKIEADAEDVKKKVGETQANLNSLNDSGSKGESAFARMTAGVTSLRGVLSKLVVPAAFIGAALRVVDLIEMWRTKGDAFRASLDDITRSFENTARSAVTAGRGGAFGDALRDVGTKAQTALQQLNAAAEAQYKDNTRTLLALFGLDISDEKIAEETTKRVNLIANLTASTLIPAAKELERKRADIEKKARTEKINAEAAAAQEAYNAAYLRTLDGEARIVEAGRQSIAKLETLRDAATSARAKSTLDATIAMEKKATEVSVAEYKRREVERVNSEIRALEAAADAQAQAADKIAKSNADAIRQVFQSINREAQSVNNTSGLEVAVGQIAQLLQAIEARTGGPL